MFTSYGPAPPQNLAGALPSTISYGAAPLPMVTVPSSMSNHGLVARQLQAPIPSPSSMVTTPMSQTAQPMQPVQSVALPSPVNASSVSASIAQSMAYSVPAQVAPGSVQSPQSMMGLPTGQSILITSQQQQMAASPAQSLQMVQAAGASPVAGTSAVMLPATAAGSGVYQPASYGQVIGSGSSPVQISASGVATPMAQAPALQEVPTENVGGTIVKDSVVDNVVVVKDAAAKKKAKKSGKKEKRCWGCCD